MSADLIDPSTPAEPLAFESAAHAQMERLVVDFGRMYRERNDALKEVTRAHHEALFRLAVAADLRDDDTGTHIVRMGFIAEAVATLLGQPPEEARLLRLAAPMHDVGKIGVPDHVLKKPGPLTPDERAIMNAHPRMGAEILGQSRIALFQRAAEVALHHHERWNGRGYPAGLAGETIPLSGRIVAAVDFFDALTMDRCYRPAFDDRAALEMLARERGEAFDPAVVDIMLAHAGTLTALRDRINACRPSYADLAHRSWTEVGRVMPASPASPH